MERAEKNNLERVRVFIAITLGPRIERELAALIGRLKQRVPDVAWARPENLHLTLRFLGGAVEAERLPPLGQALEAIASRTAPLTVAVRGIGGFPSPKRARVIWVRLEGHGLDVLARAIEEACVAAGFAPNPQPFSAHVTLGRMRRNAAALAFGEELKPLAHGIGGTARISSMSLFRSRLGPNGSVYEALAVYPFGGQSPARGESRE